MSLASRRWGISYICKAFPQVQKEVDHHFDHHAKPQEHKEGALWRGNEAMARVEYSAERMVDGKVDIT